MTDEAEMIADYDVVHTPRIQAELASPCCLFRATFRQQHDFLHDDYLCTVSSVWPHARPTLLFLLFGAGTL